MARPEARPFAFAAGALVLLAMAVAAAVVLSARPPDGPVDVAWSATPCARCGMLVSEPAFAAQLHAEDGSVRHYDDPGCLLADLAEPSAAPVHASWVRHHREQRWLPLEAAGFARVAHSPMGYGLAAVDAGEPGALDAREARAVVAGDGAAHHAHHPGAQP